MKSLHFPVGAFAACALFFSACSHAPVAPDFKSVDPHELLGQACQAGTSVKSAKGSVWLKAKSKEASGQFPAVVEAPGPDKLKLEVTNILGGTEAVISIDGRKYHIQVPHHKDRDARGESSWGGIPLQWANALFLGRIPCPDAEMLKGASLARGADGELTIETVKTLDRLPEKYVYKMRAVDGLYWAESLHWERKGMGATPVTVDFKFDDPESKTRSPQKWEAKGSQGEVKVRWKERQTT